MDDGIRFLGFIREHGEPAPAGNAKHCFAGHERAGRQLSQPAMVSTGVLRSDK